MGEAPHGTGAVLYVRVDPGRLTALGWTLMATLVALAVGVVAFAPGTIAAVLLVLFFLLALAISVVDEMTDSIHRPDSSRDRGSES
jgi:hypothetical protein